MASLPWFFPLEPSKRVRRAILSEWLFCAFITLGKSTQEGYPCP